MTATSENTKLLLTGEQRRVLSAHDRSVSLAAGAGCGKTFVLTERFLSFLDPRVLQPSAALHELFAITFTDAAAREMRDRIRRRCYQRLQQATDADEQQAWNRLLRAMDAAQISTIHSFCATLLRNFSAEAALDPRFELLDPPAADLLRLQTVDQHLRQLLVDGDQRVIRLATRFQLRNLRDNVVDLLGQDVQEMNLRWLNGSPDDVISSWSSHFSNETIPTAKVALIEADPLRQLREICAAAQVSNPGLQDHCAKICALIDALPDHDAPHQWLTELRSLARVQGVCTKKDWEYEEDYDQFSATNKAVRALLDKSPLCQQFAVSEEAREAAETGLELLQLVSEISAVYTHLKQSRNALEFDDLLTRAYRLLTDPRYPDIQRSLNRTTRLLLVDEFQDTDPLQVAIAQAFCGENWSEQGLFVVGDFKQSIYRFRGAEPRVSGELRASLPAAGQLSLTKNFRSQPAILHFVNSLFHDAFEERYEPLRPSRPQLTGSPSVEFLWALESDQGEADEFTQRLGPKQRSRVQEARYIARRLAQILQSEEVQVPADQPSADDSTASRPLQLGDIAILLRSLSDVAIYEEALREEGLDYYLAGGHAFYAQQEIHDVLNLLRSVASNTDEISLAGVLRSPFFSLEDETLFWLVEQHGSLQAGLFSDRQPQHLRDEQWAKLQRAANTLNELKASKDRLLVTELLNKAFALTGYDATILCEFLGRRKLANLQKLVEQAQTIDRTNPGDLDGFITQLSEFVARAPKEPLAATQSEGDVIRIMTIHYAKGLEFPLVVVPDLNRTYRGGQRQPVFDPQLGPLVPAADGSAFVGWDLHRYAEQQQEIEERKRLLYVACTRAADHLILSSSLADLEKPGSEWLRFLGQRFDLQTGRYQLDLPPGYEPPAVRVITEQPPSLNKSANRPRGADLAKLVDETSKLVARCGGTVSASADPVPVDHQARLRFSFSRLSGQLAQTHRPTAPNDSPDAQSSSLDPRGLGTLIHALLERVDPSNRSNLRELGELLAPQHFEQDWRQAAAEAIELVDRFLDSPRAQDLAHAKLIRRELEFLLPWSTQSAHEGRYLHGFIDCLYQDAQDRWHVIDYKSNRVTQAGVPQAAENYAMQMFVYATACQQALGVAEVQSTLHFLRSGVEFTFHWSPAEKAAIQNQIDRTMEEMLRPADASS